MAIEVLKPHIKEFVYSKRPFGWEIEGKYTKKGLLKNSIISK